mmetsp:Transcript_2880/g.8761  ORF Transcript_2880/g.8761 Transcript_2880/m.8761 type:complete len:249 (-) Transcript_2880:193-939(-)
MLTISWSLKRVRYGPPRASRSPPPSGSASWRPSSVSLPSCCVCTALFSRLEERLLSSMSAVSRSIGVIFRSMPAESAAAPAAGAPGIGICASGLEVSPNEQHGPKSVLTSEYTLAKSGRATACCAAAWCCAAACATAACAAALVAACTCAVCSAAEPLSPAPRFRCLPAPTPALHTAAPPAAVAFFLPPVAPAAPPLARGVALALALGTLTACGYGWLDLRLGRGGGTCSPVPSFCTLRKYFCACDRI